MRNPVLAQSLTLTLSLSDWLTLLGWMSAHLTEASPELIVANIRTLGNQVNMKGRAVSRDRGVRLQNALAAYLRTWWPDAASALRPQRARRAQHAGRLV